MLRICILSFTLATKTWGTCNGASKQSSNPKYSTMPGPRPAGSEISGSATAFIAKLFQNAQKKEKKNHPRSCTIIWYATCTLVCFKQEEKKKRSSKARTETLVFRYILSPLNLYVVYFIHYVLWNSGKKDNSDLTIMYIKVKGGLKKGFIGCLNVREGESEGEISKESPKYKTISKSYPECMSSENWALINSTNLEIYLNWRNPAFQIEIARK